MQVTESLYVEEGLCVKWRWESLSQLPHRVTECLVKSKHFLTYKVSFACKWMAIILYKIGSAFHLFWILSHWRTQRNLAVYAVRRDWDWNLPKFIFSFCLSFLRPYVSVASVTVYSQLLVLYLQVIQYLETLKTGAFSSPETSLVYNPSYNKEGGINEHSCIFTFVQKETQESKPETNGTGSLQGGCKRTRQWQWAEGMKGKWQSLDCTSL